MRDMMPKCLSFLLTALPLAMASPIANPYGPYKPQPYQSPPSQPTPPAGQVPGLPLPPIIPTSTIGGSDGITIPGAEPSIPIGFPQPSGSLDLPVATIPVALPTYGGLPPSIPVPTITVGGSDGTTASVPIVGPIFSSTSTTTIIVTVYPSAPAASIPDVSIPLTTITSLVTVTLPFSTGAVDGASLSAPSIPIAPSPPAYGPPPPPPSPPSPPPPNVVGGGGSLFGPGGIFGNGAGGSIFGGKPNSGKNPANGGGFIGTPAPPSPPAGGGYGYGGGSPPKHGGGDPDFSGFCDDPFFSGASSILSSFCSGSSIGGSSGSSNPPPPIPPSPPFPPPPATNPGYKRATTSSRIVTPEVVEAFLDACKKLISSEKPPSGLLEMCTVLQSAAQKPTNPTAVTKRGNSDSLTNKQYKSITDACKKAFAQVPPETPALKIIGYNAHFCFKLSSSIPASELPANGAPLSDEEKQFAIASALRTWSSKMPASASKRQEGLSDLQLAKRGAPPPPPPPNPGQLGQLQQILEVCEEIFIINGICPKLIALIPLTSLPSGAPLSESEIIALLEAAFGELGGFGTIKRDAPSPIPNQQTILAACEKAFTDLPAGNPFAAEGTAICTEIISLIPFSELPVNGGTLSADQLKQIIESVLKNYVGFVKRQGYHFPGSSSGSSGAGSPSPPPPTTPTPPYSGSTGGSSGSSGSSPAPPVPPKISPPSSPNQPYTPKPPSNPSPPATIAPPDSNLQAGIAAGVAAQLASALGPNGEFSPGNFFGDDGKGSSSSGGSGSGKGGYY